MNIYITYVFFLNIYIYLYISLLFIIYIQMYILQKKDKPRTAMQSIGPQTKFCSGYALYKYWYARHS